MNSSSHIEVSELLRELSRVSRSFKVKTKRQTSQLASWVSCLSSQQLSNCCKQVSSTDSWTTVKDILIFSLCTSSCGLSSGKIPLLSFCTDGKPVVAVNYTDYNSNILSLRYFEKKLIRALMVTLKMNNHGGSVPSIDSTELIHLLNELSDFNCFTRMPILFRGHFVVPWLQEMVRFSAGQFIVGLIELQLWKEWSTLELKTPENIAFNQRLLRNFHKTRSENLKSDDGSNVRNAVLKSINSFRVSDDNMNSINSIRQDKANLSNIHREVINEAYLSVLDILKSDDHEKLVFMLGATQKRCFDTYSKSEMKFLKSSPQAIKLWTLCYLMEDQIFSSNDMISSLSKPAVKLQGSCKYSDGKIIEISSPIRKPFETGISITKLIDCSVTTDSINVKSIGNIKGLSCISPVSNNVTNLISNMADWVVSIPLYETMTPIHEFKAILCKRLLAIGANCTANELIAEERRIAGNKSPTNLHQKGKKNGKKKRKHVLSIRTKEDDNQICGDLIHSTSIQSTPLNISMSPYMLTIELLRHSAAYIFIGQLVDKLVDSATLISDKTQLISDKTQLMSDKILLPLPPSYLIVASTPSSSSPNLSSIASHKYPLTATPSPLNIYVTDNHNNIKQIIQDKEKNHESYNKVKKTSVNLNPKLLDSRAKMTTNSDLIPKKITPFKVKTVAVEMLQNTDVDLDVDIDSVDDRESEEEDDGYVEQNIHGSHFVSPSIKDNLSATGIKSDKYTYKHISMNIY
jgi:hypothetical protein